MQDRLTQTSRRAAYDSLIDGYRVSVDRSPQLWAAAADELKEARVPLPLLHEPSWIRMSSDHWFVTARRPGTGCACGFAVKQVSTRALPGHRLFFAFRVGNARDPGALRAALQGLVEWAREQKNALRLQVDFFALDPAAVHGAVPLMMELGFSPNARPRDYEYTVLVDLEPSEEEIFASLHSTARSNIRAPAKKGYLVEPCIDARYSERLEQLTRSAMERTGGSYQPKDWEALVRFAREEPHLVRIIGTFDPGADGSRQLVGFALGEFHGDHATYADAASARTGVSVSTTYAPAWELMKWARSQGAKAFDFGGIPPEEADELSGIKSFKRYFSRTRVRVRQEWILDIAPLRSAIARAISSAADSIRQSAK